MLPWILLFSACTEFAPGVAAPTRISAAPARVANLSAAASGDLDGDGDLDLVTTAGAPLYNDGAGAFTAGAIAWHGPANAAFTTMGQVTVADMNGDGTDDVVGTWTRSGIAAVAVAYGGPTGPSDGQPLTGVWSTAYELQRVGDTDGDGRDEVAARTSLTLPEVWGYFGAAHGYVTSSYTHAEHGRLAAVGDSDGDGLDDLALGEVTLSGQSAPVRPVVWQAGSPSGPAPLEGASAFGPTYPDAAHAILADWTWSGSGPDDAMMASPRRGQIAAGTGDLNGDGLGDLVVVESTTDSWLTWFAGRAALDGGGFEPAGQLRPSASDVLSAARVVGADLDGDGTREVIVSATVHGQVVLLVFEAAPGVNRPERLIDLAFLPADGTIRALLSPGDLDGDGADDLIVDGWVLFGGDVTCPGPSAWYLDNDADGYASDAHVVWSCAQPAGASITPGGDCDDDDAAAHPGAWEYLGGDDLACDGTVLCYEDVDNDDFGGAPRPFPGFRCNGQLPLGWLDCDDTAHSRYPGAPEAVGDTVDEDCDGALTCYLDNDRDGYGSRSYHREVVGPVCDDTAQSVASTNTDCSDYDAANHDYITAYADRDGDGYGGNSSVQRCGLRAGDTLTPGDCNDNNAATWPGPTELVGGGDENCDQRIACYNDADNDGVGGAEVLDLAVSYLGTTCDSSYSYVADTTGDCDDNNYYVRAAVPGSPLTYPDADGDGWGDSAHPSTCGPVVGRVLAGGDCDDNDDLAYPGSLYERQGGPDANCDGLITCYADEDHDLHPDYQHEILVAQPACDVFPQRASDCNDAEPEAWYGHDEVLGDGIDNNCNGAFGPSLTVEPYNYAGVYHLSLTALDFPPHEVLHFLASTVGPGAGPCAPPSAGVADCADILSPRQLHTGRLAANFVEMNIVTPPVPLPRGTAIWLQVLSDTTHSPVVPYVIP